MEPEPADLTSVQPSPPPPAGAPPALGAGWALLGFFVAFFAAQVIGGIAVAAAIAILLATGSVAAPSLDDASGMMALLTHPFPLLTAAVASSVSFVGTVWGTCTLMRRPFLATVTLVRAPALAYVASVVGVFAVGLWVDEIVHVFKDLLPGVEIGALEGFANAAKAGGFFTRLSAVICMTLVPGFSEEVFFRGFFQRSLVARLGAPGGILLTSLAFGLVHIDPPQAIGALCTGLFLGWVAHRTCSIVPAIAAHVANNALAYLGSNVQSLEQYGSSGLHYPPAVLGVAAAVALGAVVVILRATPKN